MAFRNIKCVVPRETNASTLVELVGDEFKSVNLNKVLPCSSDYSLKDLLASGVKVPQVDPTIVHDSASVSAVADSFVQSQSENEDNNNTNNN